MDDPCTNYFLDLFYLMIISVNTAIIAADRLLAYFDDAVAMFSIDFLEHFLFQHLRCQNYHDRVSKFLVCVNADAYKFVVFVEELKTIFYC